MKLIVLTLLYLVIIEYSRIVLVIVVWRIALFIDCNLSYKDRPDLNATANVNFECVFVELIGVPQKNKIVGSIYRPPDSNLDLFMFDFESVLTILNKTKSECLLAGDYNINLLKHEVNDGTRNFVNCLYDISLIPLITRPTFW